MNNEKISKFNKIYPWYSGLSGDLLFWVAIDTLFLTVVKNFTASQIVSLTTISLIICIVLQIPLIRIIRKIGNTKSVRLGSFLLLISSILLTFGNSYLIIVLGKILYEIAFTFQNMSNIVLKNNLQIQDRSDDYIKVKTKCNTIYSGATMIISFIASYMFNLNNYLPMIFCILFCIICFILSFDIIDFSKFDKIENTSSKNKKKLRYTKLLVILIISYGLFYPIVNSGQLNGKLFIQQELLINFTVEKTAIIIGVILSVSRIIRVISNMIFDKMYKKFKDKIGVILPVLLAISILLMIVGYFIRGSIILKFLIMSIGYIIILFIRDPFKIYMQDLALNSTSNEYHQTLLTTIELYRKIVRAIISLGFSIVLIDYPMILVISILLILSILEILISIKLYKLVINANDVQNIKETV